MSVIHLGEHVLTCIANRYSIKYSEVVYSRFLWLPFLYGWDMQILAIYHVAKATNSNHIQPGIGHKR